MLELQGLPLTVTLLGGNEFETTAKVTFRYDLLPQTLIERNKRKQLGQPLFHNMHKACISLYLSKQDLSFRVDLQTLIFLCDQTIA